MKHLIKRLALNYQIFLERAHADKELAAFIHKFNQHFISCDLIRVGGDNDGGYLLPDILDGIECCFSPGVADNANFEYELSKNYGIRSFMVDGSVNGPPFENNNFDFQKKFLTSYNSDETITLSSWIDECIGAQEKRCILQMDIEGSEYEVLSFEPLTSLNRFDALVIEFHSFHKIFTKDFLKITRGIFEKILSNFSICHVHVNNCLRTIEIDGISVPPVLEVTFIRNDLVNKHVSQQKLSLPHILDMKNVLDRPDILLPKIWWQK
jgi:hypothetical protein